MAVTTTYHYSDLWDIIAELEAKGFQEIELGCDENRCLIVMRAVKYSVQE